MKSFEEHLRGAKAHNREDKIWLVTCFSGKMAKLCAKYGFPDDEDIFLKIICRKQDSIWQNLIIVIADEVSAMIDHAMKEIHAAALFVLL